MKLPNWNDHTLDEKERLLAVSAAHAAIKKLREVFPKITTDECHTRWLTDNVDGIGETLEIIEKDMARAVRLRKAPFKNLIA